MEDTEIEGLMNTLEDEMQRKRAAQNELAACREILKQVRWNYFPRRRATSY
jgi:hypothetical protein